MSLFSDWRLIELQNLTTRSHDPLFGEESSLRLEVNVEVTIAGFLLVN